MFVLLLGLSAWLAPPPAPTVTSLVGYKASIRTIVFEDGSISRMIRVALTAHQPDALAFKKEFLTRNGYLVVERTMDDMPALEATKVFVPTRFEPLLKDQVSHISVHQVQDTVFYHEIFSTVFLTGEVAASDLKNDLPAAKVLLAETEFDFLTVLPGKVMAAASGDFSQDSIRWNYDVERMFANASFVMTAQSSVARQEELIWIVYAIGIMMSMIGVLLLIKSHIARRRALQA